MANPLDDLLGLGYSGYAKINNVPIFLAPSDVAEEENLLISEAPFATEPQFAVGSMTARNRRSLRISLRTPLCRVTQGFPAALAYGLWRNSGAIDTIVPTQFQIILAGGEGFTGSGYIDKVSLSASEGSNIILNIEAVLWVWDNLVSGIPTVRQGSVLLPLTDAYKPVPYYLSKIDTLLVSTQAINLRWELVFNNNWQYEQLLEGTDVPPNPTHIYPGPLDVDITMAWLARRNDRPVELGSAVLTVRDPVSTDAGNLYRINLPRLVRNGRPPSGLGDGNAPIIWEATYTVQGLKPT